METQNKKQVNQLTINMIAQIVAFCVNMGISFVLTPYIVNNIGDEVYGFVGLANNFVGYAQIATVALNSMAGRFITISLCNNEIERAKRYYSSVFIGNVILIGFLCLPLFMIVWKMEMFLNISPDILLDVKVLWLLTFVNFLVSILNSVYSISTFVKNRLDLTSKKTIISYGIRVVILVTAYLILGFRQVWYVGLSVICSTVYLMLAHIKISHEIVPELEIKRAYFDKVSIFELLAAGGWNLLSKMSQLLNTGMDLLLSNVFLGASVMGVLSISKTLPSAFISFTAVASSVFCPALTISYAKDTEKEVVKDVKQSIKVMTLFCSIFFAFIVVLGKLFYRLWTPEQDSQLLYEYTLLAIFHMPITSGMNTIYNVFQITNKVKKSAVPLFIISVINIVILLCAVNLLDTSAAAYCVAGMSSLLALLVMLFVIIPEAGVCLTGNKGTFLSGILYCVFGTGSMVLAFWGVNVLVKPDSWGSMITTFCLGTVLGGVIQIVFGLSKDERNKLFLKVLKSEKSF